MKTFIRLLSVFLAVLMICFSFPLSVLAVEPSADQEVQAVESDKMGNVTEENWKERAYEAMEGEIKIYDYYIRGEVYGFIVYKAATIEHRNVVTDESWITEEWEEEDSCWGYYSDEHDKSGLLDGALECLPDDLEIVKE